MPSTIEPNQLTALVPPPTVAKRLLEGVTGKVFVGDSSVLSSPFPWRAGDLSYLNNEVGGHVAVAGVLGSLSCERADNRGHDREDGRDRRPQRESNQVRRSGRNRLQLCGPSRARSSQSHVANLTVALAGRLSGMPDLTLTFNRPSLIDDYTLHRCVRISKFQNERVISFLPPDGKFKLFTFRVRGVTQLPLYVRPNLVFSPGLCKVTIVVGPKFIKSEVGHLHALRPAARRSLSDRASRQAVEGVSISIPAPPGATSVTLSSPVGEVKTDPMTKTTTWHIGQLSHERKDRIQLEGELRSGLAGGARANSFRRKHHAAARCHGGGAPNADRQLFNPQLPGLRIGR